MEIFQTILLRWKAGFRIHFKGRDGNEKRARDVGRVEMWRGGLGLAYLYPALSVAGASLS